MSEAAYSWFTTYKYYELIQACNALIPIRSSQVKARGRYGEGEDRQSNITIDLQTTRIGGKKKRKGGGGVRRYAVQSISGIPTTDPPSTA